ncbi:uncharacterized protein LOC132068612 [Lycium ferocissimum]|uniref:uncharacterized protein LOC132068612 n=1 Tax=Lycium ferocissimum TaxID=112874 RepID=UPI0028166AC5|nr:uncharacterized protein LOC132068612 [Lycium ferocissimum]
MEEKSKMQKKKSLVARRAWNVLRLALLWARKGGIFKKRWHFHLLPKYIKNLHHTNNYGALHYGERELSFDDTPIFHVKMHRPASLRFKMPNIPCIKPQVDFDFDFDFDNDHDQSDDEMYHGNEDDDDVVPRKSFLNGTDDYCEENEIINAGPGDEAIDMKAEEFIAKFYEQIKMQRQISYLRYHETIVN